MRNLPIPATNDNIKLHEIINSKNDPYKKRLLRIPNYVISRYKEYDLLSTQLENIKNSKIIGVYITALTKCYTSSTSELSKMRSLLLYPEVEDFDECPFCGINEPKTLDHYLPKEEFPEFSVLSKNLIPICSVCNSIYKGKKWIENGERLFLHSYYDIFPDEYFIDSYVVVKNKINISFTPKIVATEPIFSSLFKNHFDNLDLNNRFKIKARSEISRKRKALNSIYLRNNSPVEVSDELKREADKLEGEFSKNHWKPVLYRALSQSDSFCDNGFQKPVTK